MCIIIVIMLYRTIRTNGRQFPRLSLAPSLTCVRVIDYTYATTRVS